jgi:predicted nucleotide-binding protein
VIDEIAQYWDNDGGGKAEMKSTTPARAADQEVEQMKPRVFVGSTVEGLKLANAIQELLDHDAEVRVWNQGIFHLSSNTLDDMIEALDGEDFGVFVFSPDDVLQIRDETHSAVRDNVLIEFGLFVGKLGKRRTFIVVPRDSKQLHLPTDLLGFTPATYDSKRAEGDEISALGATCNQLRRAIRKQGRIGSRAFSLETLSTIPSDLKPDYKPPFLKGPYIKITSVEYPTSLHHSQPFEIVVKARNNGDSAGEGYFSVSFPDGVDGLEIESDTSTQIGLPGARWSNGRVVLQYPIAEGYKPAKELLWLTGAEFYIKVRGSLRWRGVNRFYVNAISRGGTAAQWVQDPFESLGDRDQRGEDVYCGAVEVR